MATLSVKPNPAVLNEDATISTRTATRSVRILIVFNTVSLYGMERYVIELFDLLRPEVQPHFLLSYTTRRMQLPLLKEIELRGLEHSFFSDRLGWPKIGRPHTPRQAWQMTIAMFKGNRDVLRQALDCDVIYLPAWGYGLFALIAGAHARLTGKRVVYGFHDLPRAWQLPLRLISLMVSDCVHHTRFGYEFTTRTNPYIVRKKNFICPGRTQSWRLCEADPQVQRALEGKRNLLFIGQMSRPKGIDLLLEAFASLATEYPDAQLHVVGDGPEEDRLRHTIASMGLDSRVHFWGYRDDVHDFLRSTYLYVHPSPPSRFVESFGRGVVEAMSQGVPVVCFRSGALEEIVLHEQTGLVCEQETVASLAANVRRFLDDRRFRASCGRAGLTRFRENYSDEVIRTHWLQFFRVGVECEC